MKKLVFVFFAGMLMMTACGNKTKQAAGDADSLKDSLAAIIDSIIEENDTTPMPMYLAGEYGKYQAVIYWTSIEEPQKEGDDSEGWYEVYHRSWALQDMFRRNAAQYTNMLASEKFVKVRFVDEILKDPDGNTPSIGQLHGRTEIPSLCARFEPVDAKDKSQTGMLIVTDSYLATRKFLKMHGVEETELPQNIVKELEKKYGMKAQNSQKYYTFGEGNRYAWGMLQFEGEYKNAPKDPNDNDRKFALALDVLIDGDKYFVNEALGYYDESYGPTWNVDDEGLYLVTSIDAAFEGPKGLELCYSRPAPESYEVGMFYQRDDKLIKHTYEMYQTLIDEEVPVWKSDIAEMKRLFVAHDPGENKHIELTKWAHIDIDYDNEWVYLRDANDDNGAIFKHDKDNKWKLIAVETPKLKFSQTSKNGISYLRLSGSAGGPSTYTEIHAFENGKEIETFNAIFVYGEIESCELNGKEISKEAGQAYFDKLPEDSELTAYFKDIDQKSE